MKPKTLIIWLVCAIAAYLVGFLGYRAVKPTKPLNAIQQQPAPSLPQ